MKNIPMMSKVHTALMMLIFMASMRADDCCPSICNLFDCGNWSYQNRIGVYPTIWRERGHVFLNSCDCVTGNAVTGADLGELPKFNKFYNVPWIVGTQLQFSWNDCWRLYGELNYIQASHKKTPRNTVQALNSQLAIVFDTYRAISGYVGAMYNLGDWSCFCENGSFFIGAKIGFIYRENILARQVTLAPSLAPTCGCVSLFKRDFFKHGAKISGGANLGFEYGWCDRWSIVLMGEVVVSGGPKGNSCVPLTTAEIVQIAGGSNLGVTKVKTEISFPVTLGLKYDF